ncbi:MAG: hypothetical protein U1E70_18070 [Acetobacteraceae bacterium]
MGQRRLNLDAIKGKCPAVLREAPGPAGKTQCPKGKGEILAARIDQTAEDQLCATRITRLNGLVVGQRPGDRQAAVRSAVARVNVQYILVEEIPADLQRGIVAQREDAIRLIRKAVGQRRLNLDAIKGKMPRRSA